MESGAHKNTVGYSWWRDASDEKEGKPDKVEKERVELERGWKLREGGDVTVMRHCQSCVTTERPDSDQCGVGGKYI